MTKSTLIKKRSGVISTRKVREPLEVMFEEIQQEGIIPMESAGNEVCLKRYEKWASTLRKTYRDALQKENLEVVYTFNRRMGPVMQQLRQFAYSQKQSDLYAMGMFHGVFAAMSSMLPQRNDEQIFNIQMAELKERAYVKQILKILYDGECVRHNQICNRINTSPSQLSRTMSDLINIGCVNRYRNGKASVYVLTPMGKKYAREILGCRRQNYAEYDSMMLAGKKPQIQKKKRDMITSVQAYCISGDEGKLRKGNYYALTELGREG